MEDPYLWLEEVESDAALDWARERNEQVRAQFAASAQFADLQTGIRAMLDTDTKIPYVTRRAEWLYNFWRDAAHPKGLWRRTTLDSYRTDSPEWDLLIDLDALAAAEDENWVWAGAAVLRPSQQRALVNLSRGGADATVVREFDLDTKTFVADGFGLAEAKSQVSWIDTDHIYVGTDFGPGSLTESGYPRIAKRWRRGTALDAAETVFEGEPTDVSAGAGYDRTPGFERHYVYRSTDFFNSTEWLRHDDGTLEHLDVPTDSDSSWYKNWLLVRLKTPWELATTYPAGALLAIPFDEFRSGARDFEVLFAPDAHSSLVGYGWTEHHLVLQTLVDVQAHLEVLTPGADGWTRRPLADVPPMATAQLFNLDPLDSGDAYMLNVSGFTMPATVLSGDIDSGAVPIKQAPEFYDATDMGTEQFFATSLDGTQVPYFVVRRKGLTGPTILYGYGGFENSELPGYSGGIGMGWLAAGGVWVSANIRGGGEYGPQWHTQAQRAGRHLAFEDFAAVATDLVRRGITKPAQLGCLGGSNGGLLTGVMLTRYPELFGAIVCRVPLLDMRRYHLLLAGASWVAEYGNPDDPAEWAFLQEYSPYQNVSAERPYPPILLTTSTRDDRVHPGHARKMCARLEESGHEVWYYENIEGGHGGAADNAQQAFVSALSFEFFARKLGLRD